MSCEVYANGMSIACKAADGKTIAAFPDVCFTPPMTPATPPGVPIPYPNTGMASDTANGTKTVQISGQEVMLKNISYFKTSTGDEAGSAPKKGIITSQIKGKVNFTSWSMDVKFEGENVPRHLDLTGHNEASDPPNTPPWTYLDRMAMAEGIEECNDAREEVKNKCGKNLNKKARCPSAGKVVAAEKVRAAAKKKFGDGSPEHVKAQEKVDKQYNDYAKRVQKNPCQRALRCFLTPYKPPSRRKGAKTGAFCCSKQTAHHVIDATSFLEEAVGLTRDDPARPKKTGWKNYDVDAAPCVCVEGPNQTTATHGEMHARTSVKAEALMDKKGQWARNDATASGVDSINETYPDTKSCKECLQKQMDRYHDSAKTTADDRPIDATTEGSPELKAQFRQGDTFDDE